MQGARRAIDREASFAPNLSDESVMALSNRLISSGTTPSRHALRKELRERVRAALAELSEPHREALVMRHLEGLSIHEIAAVTSVCEGTVKSRLFRGMAHLQERLDDPASGDQA